MKKSKKSKLVLDAIRDTIVHWQILSKKELTFSNFYNQKESVYKELAIKPSEDGIKSSCFLCDLDSKLRSDSEVRCQNCPIGTYELYDIERRPGVVYCLDADKSPWSNIVTSIDSEDDRFDYNKECRVYVEELFKLKKLVEYKQTTEK